MGISCQQDQVGSFALYFCCAVCTARLSSLANYRVQQLSVHKECYHVSMLIQTFGHLPCYHMDSLQSIFQSNVLLSSSCELASITMIARVLFCDVLCSSIGLRLICLPVQCQAQ
jgi:hypothetical protein